MAGMGAADLRWYLAIAARGNDEALAELLDWIGSCGTGVRVQAAHRADLHLVRVSATLGVADDVEGAVGHWNAKHGGLTAWPEDLPIQIDWAES